jgi:hypothetical protein
VTDFPPFLSESVRTISKSYLICALFSKSKRLSLPKSPQVSLPQLPSSALTPLPFGIENEELSRQLSDLSREVDTLEESSGVGQVSAIHAQLNVITQEYKTASNSWLAEKSALLREKDKLQREVIALRKHRLSDTMDDLDMSAHDSLGGSDGAGGAGTTGGSLNESGVVFKLIDSTGRARLAAEQAIASNDMKRMKEELKHQVHLLSFSLSLHM